MSGSRFLFVSTCRKAAAEGQPKNQERVMKRYPLNASSRLFAQMWADDCGAMLSVELVVFLTILVIGLVPGYIALRQGSLTKLLDLANSVMALNTSYSFSGQQLVDPNEEVVTDRHTTANATTTDAYGFKPVRDLSDSRNATTTHKDTHKHDWNNRNTQAWTGGSAAIRPMTHSIQDQSVDANDKGTLSGSSNRPAPLD
jgi:hypothetical protein